MLYLVEEIIDSNKVRLWRITQLYQVSHVLYLKKYTNGSFLL